MNTTLYRFYDAAGDLLYVGIAANPGRRFHQHAGDKTWWTQVVGSTMTHYPTSEAAAYAEIVAITNEHPRHNVVHNRARISGVTAAARAKPSQVGMGALFKRLSDCGTAATRIDVDLVRLTDEPVLLVVTDRPVAPLVGLLDVGSEHPGVARAAAARAEHGDIWTLLTCEVEPATPMIEVNTDGIITDTYRGGHYFTMRPAEAGRR
jgi:hypothetical protein